ncbi:hypothetical protein [Dyella nitratireducens]|uniref:Uncharacterized protein n=1 Tax=Dyella nitratireducens TaxID=1849580 RepID=A0ABQ1FJZ5_9GAMM|nr:hypothetical protein [Dyella nitratireducens]GGA16681.1 hypothetical protein GCM10010981_00420 [Dyella nitratireducens]GLQ44898.1 hypothetical protein GCM10007902_47480 [Dyella nitratireducens]
MPTLSHEAQVIIAAFETQPGVTPDQVQNLRASIEASAALIEQINTAVKLGYLKQIEPISHSHAGGEYDAATKAMRLPLRILSTRSDKTVNTGEVVFTLGHELQHGFNHATTVQAYATFSKEATQAAKTHHDYTAAIGNLIAANRRDEASAEISGWNAIVSQIKTSNPTPTLADIYNAQPTRLRDFIEQSGDYPVYVYALQPNLTLNPDLTLSPTPANLEAMGRNFFDKEPKESALGALGKSDYANYYGAWAIGEAAKLERHYNRTPSITVNLSQLHLSEKLLEENGIDLGSNPSPIPYYDSSSLPPAKGLFQHTITTHEHVLPISARAYEVERERNPELAPPWQREHAWPARCPHIDKNSSIDDMFEALYQAAIHKDDALARQVGRAYAQSDAGQLFFEQGHLFNQQQQLQEQQAELVRQQQQVLQTPVQHGPVLTLSR